MKSYLLLTWNEKEKNKEDELSHKFKENEKKVKL